MFRKDQKVWCLIYGQGVVTEILHASEGTYPVEVKFNDDFPVLYTADGKFYNQGNIVLFPHPVEIVKATTKPSTDWSHVSEDFQWLCHAPLVCRKARTHLGGVDNSCALHLCRSLRIFHPRYLRLERLSR